MITKEQAQTFAHHWIESWNAHDMDAILSHYTDDFEMTSPFIVSLTGEASGTLKGKDAIGEYWRNALVKFPDLHFELIEVLTSVDTVTIYYTSILDKRAVEWLQFDNQGKVYKAAGHYN